MFLTRLLPVLCFAFLISEPAHAASIGADWELEYDVRSSHRGYQFKPILKGGMTRVRDAVQAVIDQGFQSLPCRQPRQHHMDASRILVEPAMLSFKLLHYRSCDDENTPNLTISGMNFDLQSGKLLGFERNAPGADRLVERVLEMARRRQRIARGLDCSAPQFSGSFYLTAHKVVFVGFFRDYRQSPCELEIELPREDVRSYLAPLN